MSYSLENQTLHVSVGEEAVDVDVGFIFHSSDRKEVGLVVISHVDTRCNLVKAITIGGRALRDDPSRVERVIPVFHKQTT